MPFTMTSWRPSLEAAVEVDHAICEAPDCDRVVCCCHRPQPCPGTTVQACPHHGLLCEDCAPVECVDCRIDRQDGAA